MIRASRSLRLAFTACLAQLWCFKKTGVFSMSMIVRWNPGVCVLAYLCTFLWRVHSHHVVPEKLLKELHLGNAEVEVQTAGHIYLQGVATHQHLLHTDEERRQEGHEGRGGWRGQQQKETSGLFATLSPSLYEHSLLLSAILAHLFLLPLFLCPLQGPTHPQWFQPQPEGYISQDIIHSHPRVEPHTGTDTGTTSDSSPCRYRYICIDECYQYYKVNKCGLYVKINIYRIVKKEL